MRFSRLVIAVVSLGLLSLPVAAVAADSGPWTTQVQIQRAPAKQVFNENVEVAGRLSRNNPGNPTPEVVAGAPLKLERRLVGSTSWVQLGSGKVTDAVGVVVFTTKAKANASYRITFAGGADPDNVGVTLAASNSPVVGLKVFRNLGAREHKIGGRRFAFFGKVHPRYAHKVVVLQQKKCGGCAWRTIGRQRTTGRSVWRFVVLAKPTHGVWKYRAFTPKNKKFLKSYSALYKITTF